MADKTENRDTGEEVETVDEHFADIVTASVMVPIDDPNQEVCRYGLKSIFWGPSGIGKSDRIRQGGAKVELPVRAIIPGQRQPEDFGGIPVYKDGELSVECVLGAVRDLNKHGKGILFIDEASTAPPAVQGAMLSMINDGVVGDTVIKPRVRIILAANPPHQSAGGWGLEAPMANRLAHFYVKCPSVTDWVHWLVRQGDEEITPLAMAEETLKTNWQSNWPYIQGLLSGFMEKSGTAMLHAQPSSDDPKAGYAWPSPRTWVAAGRAVATIRSLGMKEELEHFFVSACVGKGAAIEWAEYVASADLPHPEKVLNEGWNIDETRLDKVLAVNTAVVSFVKGIKDKDKRYEMATKAWNYIGRVVDKNLSDTVAYHGDELIRAKLGTKEGPDSLKNAAKAVIYRLAKDPAATYERD